MTFLKHIRWIFAVALIAGAAIIVAAHWPKGAAQGVPFLPTGIVLGIMLVYGAILLLRSRTPYRSTGDGDSFYYLGFIFTLVTLVAALTPFLSASQSLDEKRVLGIFGLGLATTFVGLSGRIFFSHFDEAPAAPLDQEVARVSAAMREMARVIETSGADIVRASARTQGSLAESTEKARHSIEDATNDLRKSVVAAARLTLEEISTLSRQISDVLKRDLPGAISETALDIREGGKRVGASLRGIGDDLGADGKRIASALAKAVSILEASSAHLSDRLRHIAEIATDLVNNTKTYSATLSELTEKNQQAADSIQGSQAQLVEACGRLGKAAGDACAKLSDIGPTATGATIALASINIATDDLAVAARNAKSAFQVAADTAKANLAEIEQLRMQLDSEVKKSSEAVRMVHDNLIQMIQYVSKRLG